MGAAARGLEMHERKGRARKVPTHVRSVKDYIYDGAVRSCVGLMGWIIVKVPRPTSRILF